MKIRTFVIPLVTFVLSGFIIAGVFLERVIPSLNNNLSPDIAFIDLGESQGHYKYAAERKDAINRYNYAEILGDYQLAMLYLSSPLYFYKRGHGLEILQTLAEQNYTQAAISLAAYHKNKMNSDKFYRWAKLAAEQGDKSALLIYVKDNTANLTQKELDETLEILDMWAEKSIWPSPSWELFDYYKTSDNPEKAAKFRDLFTARLANPAQEPICTTITPWRGL